jgi:hypothetical protein
MPRSHFYRPITDSEGNLVTDASVAVYNPGTTVLVSATLWDSADVPTGVAIPNPFNPSTGIADFYMDAAQTVQLGITRAGGSEVLVDNIDVGDPEDYKESFTFSLSGPLATQTSGLRFYVEDASVITQVRASLGTAPVGQAAILDINKNGSSIFTSSPHPQVADGAHTGTATPDVTGLAPGDYLTIDVDQVGLTTTGSDLVVQVRVRRL